MHYEAKVVRIGIMKIGIYDPYLDTLGGGEKYIFSIANYFKDEEVTLFWDNEDDLKKAKDRFGVDTSFIKLEKDFFKNSSIFHKFMKTRRYDCLFFMSDGSLPFLFSKKNIVIFQFPVNWVRAGILTKLKLILINKVICYSVFVKEHIDKTFDINSQVLPPPIDPNPRDVQKENLILTVGRFTKAMNTKKQDFLVDVFKKNSKAFEGWRLAVVGSSLDSDQDFVRNLKDKAKDSAIDVETNISYAALWDLYSKSKIYWHAAGFGENLEAEPEKAEHFGISTVEAMSLGAVPVVINAGGQKEIVERGVSGMLWSSEEELVHSTQLLIQDEKLLEKLSEKATERSKEYTSQKFNDRLSALLNT